MRLLILLIILCNTAVLGIAQTDNDKEKVTVYNIEDSYEDDPYYWSYTKEIGINFTPLISKFVPFNLGENNAGNIGLRWKKYYSKRAFRLNFGADINSKSINLGKAFGYLALGIETRHPITKDKKITYTSAYDVFFEALDEVANFGFSKGYGLEYHFGKRIFISTEAAFQIATNTDDEGILINFQLPTAIFVNVRLY